MSPHPRSARAAVAGAAPIFAALGDETRLGLVMRLSAEGPLSIARLSAGVPVTRQAVTKHLHALAAAGLVRGSGGALQRRRLWELDSRRLREASRQLDRISQRWDDALGRLKTFVER